MKKKVLLVEDNIEISDLIVLHIENDGFQIDKALDGEIGLSKAQNNQYSLIILDLSLPKVGGLEICKSLREGGNLTPILILSAWSEDSDKVNGLLVGADAYLTKPFSLKSLTENVQHLIDGGSQTTTIEKSLDLTCKVIAFKNFTIDTERKIIIINGKHVTMDSKAYNLLNLLVCNQGKIFTRSEILQLIWGFDLRTYRYKVTSCINRIRRKIEPDFLKPIYILSDEGGFKFNEKILSMQN